MAKILLDRIVDLILVYFGSARGCSLRSHHSFLKNYDKYFKTQSIPPSSEFLNAIQQLQIDVCEFRDKKIVHQNNPRLSLGIAYPEGQGAYLSVGHFYPKVSDESYESQSLDKLSVKINDYADLVLAFLIANREHVALKLAETE